MTPEQKQQRLDEIRKRRNCYDSDSLREEYPHGWRDVDFLLSLVKSQEADHGNDQSFYRPVHISGWHKGLDGGGWYIKDARNKIILEVCFDETEQRRGRPITGGNPAARAIVALINDCALTRSDAATSACVEKVKALWKRYHDDAEKADNANDNINMLILLHKASAASEVIKELESVSIEASATEKEEMNG